MLENFFIHSIGGWRQKRAQEEIKYAESKSKAAKQSAEVRWKRNANAMRTHTEGNAIPDSRLQTPEKERIREEKTNTAATQHIVSVTTWLAFVEMRKKIRKPLTDRAGELIRTKLERLQIAGNNPEEVLEQSIVNCWAGVFELRKENGNGKTTGKSFDRIRNENTDAALARIIEHAEESISALPSGTRRTNAIDLLPGPKRPPN